MVNKKNKTENKAPKKKNQWLLNMFQKVCTEAEHALSFITAACLCIHKYGEVIIIF